jgi:hypothetical protein
LLFTPLAKCTEFFLDNKWYTLDGRQLQGQPTVKGLYIQNGKKVMVK